MAIRTHNPRAVDDFLLPFNACLQWEGGHYALLGPDCYHVIFFGNRFEAEAALRESHLLFEEVP